MEDDTNMNALLDKLSSYNLFNYLLPGIVFVTTASKFTTHDLIQPDIVIGVFVYYFIGLVISRFGSLVVEPLLRRVSYLTFVDYKDFVAASQKDPKIEILSEANNTYRTFCSLFVLILLVKLGDKLLAKCPSLSEWVPTALIVGLLAMFLLSYRKQTQYVAKRVKANG